jgi:hypothetical protein
MKTQLFLFNGLSLVTYLVWLGWFALKSLARAYGNANPSTGPGDVGWVFIVVGIAGAACSVYSFFAPGGAARVVASAPLVLILLGHGFIAYREATHRNRPPRQEPGDREAQQRKLRGISRDYAEPSGRSEDRNFSFLTHDREFDTIVLIQAAYGFQIHARCIGKIDGAFLDTYQPGDHLKESYAGYVDGEGKSIFDRYTLRHRPDQDTRKSQLQKYKP